MRKLLIEWENRATCEKCDFFLMLDVAQTILYWSVGYFVYPYLTYPELWWLWSIFYITWMVDHVFMLCFPNDPPWLTFRIFIAFKRFSEGELRAARRLYNMRMEMCNTYYHHFHGEHLLEIVKKAKEELDEQEKLAIRTHPDRQDVAPVLEKKLTKKEELQTTLGECSETLNKWEEMFDHWSSYKAKEMADLVSEETNAEEQKDGFCRQRERIKEEVARLELEGKELAKNIVGSETNRNKLVKKRHKFESRTDERLYELKVKKAKLLDAIQKIRFELTMIQDHERREMDTNKETKEEKDSRKSERAKQLTKEIEEKERDLECPVCFEVCTKPIFMCDHSHQICKHCRPKMKVCPQCREPYKKYKKRNPAKEMTSDQLQMLYKNMEELLEAD